jgi:hypothetical protein
MALLASSGIMNRRGFRSAPVAVSTIPQSGLSLWLKADAGVTTFSFSYKSNITLSGAGESSINGSYTASAQSNGTNSYIMSGPNNNRIEVRPSSTPRYRVYNLDNSTNSTPWFYPFTSSDGVSWTAVGKKPVSITLSGLTGASAQSNGTYNSFEWDVNNRSFISYKSVSGGVDTNIAVEVYPDGSAGAYIFSPTFFVSAQKSTGWGIGSWTIEEGTGSPVGTGTLYPTGGVPTGVVTTTTVNTDNVTSWADQSGNGNNAAYSSSTPIYNVSDLNSKPTISLTSMSDYVERVFSISINPLGVAGSTAFSVQYVEDVCDAGDDNGPIFGNFGATIDDGEPYSQTHYPYGPDCSVYDSFATTSRKNSITPPATITDTWSLYSVYSTNGDWKSFVNGYLMHSDSGNTYNNSIGGDDTTLYIGKQTAGGTYALKGKVAEVIVYNRVLTTIERQQVEAYLNTKYAIY